MQTTRQVLYDGGHRTTMQFTGVSDGLGDETNQQKVIVSELVPVPVNLKVEKLTYEISGGMVRLYWDADDPVEFLALAGSNILDYSKIGGMPNPRPPGMTGNISLSTVGFDMGSSYSLTFDMLKKF